jgi:hypothetical protein
MTEEVPVRTGPDPYLPIVNGSSAESEISLKLRAFAVHLIAAPAVFEGSSMRLGLAEEDCR